MTTIILALLLLPATGGFLDNGATEDPGTSSATAARVESREAAQITSPAEKAVLLALENRQATGEKAGAAADPAIPSVPEPVATASLFPHVDARSYVSDLTVHPSGLFVVAATPVKLPEQHRFFDRDNVIGFSIHAAVRAVDAAQSCVAISRGAHETWLPMKGCAGIAAYSMSMVPAQIGTSYLLHRRGYHRLEKLSPYAWAAPSAAGIGVSMRAW